MGLGLGGRLVLWGGGWKEGGKGEKKKQESSRKTESGFDCEYHIGATCITVSTPQSPNPYSPPHLFSLRGVFKFPFFSRGGTEINTRCDQKPLRCAEDEATELP